MDDDIGDDSLIDWEARLEAVRQEHSKLFSFVEGGHDRGEVRLEAKRAFYKAALRIMDRGGLPTTIDTGTGKEDPVGAAARCVILAQALHEARTALLEEQPELTEKLNREVPSVRGGRLL